MISKTKTRSNVIRTAILGVSLLGLSACTDFGPYPLATGYKYQQNEYKSAAGPEPVIEKYTRRDDNRGAVHVDEHGHGTMAPAPVSMDYWGMAADELVARMVQNLGLPAEPVYIAEHTAMTNEEVSFAAALREAMLKNNIPMAPRTSGAPFGMEYAISIVDVGSDDRRLITIQLISAGDIVHEESGIYTVHTNAVYAAEPVPMVQTVPNDEPVSITP